MKEKVKTETRQEIVASVKEVQTPQDGEIIYHKIKSGDTLGAIAKRYGISVSKLCELNGIERTTILKLGRSLRCS